MTVENESDNYFVGVDDREIARLGHQHEAWRAETTELWKAAGFENCASVIDLGSGPGFTTLDLARTIVRNGGVWALDKAAYFLDYTAKEAERRGVRNVRVVHADITKPGAMPETFEGAFCRWFLAFLTHDLETVLRNIRGCLQPGGRFAVMEYLTLDSVTCGPPHPAFDAHTQAWIQFYADNGGDTSIGAKLPANLVATGFDIEMIKCIGGLATPGHRWWEWWGRLMQDFGPKFVDLGLLAPAQWASLQDYWQATPGQAGAFIHTPLMLQIVARRK